jgi:hypothetical protein
MAFTGEELGTLQQLFAAGDGDAASITEFRARFPGRSVTRCDRSDLGGEAPFLRCAAVDIHLVDGRDHCWTLTRDPQAATGIVVARHPEAG